MKLFQFPSFPKKISFSLLGSLGFLTLVSLVGLLSSCKIEPSSSHSPGVTLNEIRLGSVLVLQGQEEALGNGMRLGIEASLAGEKVQGRSLKIIFKNDYYEPASAHKATEELIESEDIFLALGNVGTPTAQVTLPLLEQQNIPAVGFVTGAQLLRDNEARFIVNFRASYRQEIAAVVEMAIAAGLKPSEICAYVQDDGYGLDALKSLKQILAKMGASQDLIERYDQILASSGDRNNLGPVGVYTRNTPYSEPGYNSLKKWESDKEISCKIILTASTYRNLAYFVKMSREQGEKMVDICSFLHWGG